MKYSKVLFVVSAFLLFNLVYSQEMPGNSSQSINTFEPEWSFGAQLQQGLTFNYYDYDGDRYHGSTSHALGLGFLANYKWKERHALHTELNFLTGNRNTALGANLQYEYSFSDRWSIYGGVGLEYTFPYNYVSPYIGEERKFVPTAMLGIRYKASKWIALDLRYQRDLTDRFNPASDLTYPQLRKVNQVTLGVQVRF